MVYLSWIELLEKYIRFVVNLPELEDLNPSFRRHDQRIAIEGTVQTNSTHKEGRSERMLE
jgi:hypothetical protein